MWSIVVPMYQEESRIVGTIEQLAASSLNTADNEFVFVDDGSTDRTVEVLEKALAETPLAADVIRLPRNLGKGAAVQAGMLAARSAWSRRPTAGIPTGRSTSRPRRSSSAAARWRRASTSWWRPVAMPGATWSCDSPDPARQPASCSTASCGGSA